MKQVPVQLSVSSNPILRADTEEFIECDYTQFKKRRDFKKTYTCEEVDIEFTSQQMLAVKRILPKYDGLSLENFTRVIDFFEKCYQNKNFINLEKYQALFKSDEFAVP